jgi:hypothetical protein
MRGMGYRLTHHATGAPGAGFDSRWWPLPWRHGTPTMTVMQQNPETGKFEKTDAETVARKWLRENTRFLKYLV